MLRPHLGYVFVADLQFFASSATFVAVFVADLKPLQQHGAFIVKQITRVLDYYSCDSVVNSLE